MAKTSTLYPELNFGLSEGCIEAGLKISSLETLSKMDFNCNLDGFLELDYTQRLQKLPMHFPRFASPHCSLIPCMVRCISLSRGARIYPQSGHFLVSENMYNGASTY